MKTKQEKNAKGSLNVYIQAHGNSYQVFKHLQLFDENIRLEKTIWLDSNQMTISDIKEGTYVARLTLNSGVYMDEIVEIFEKIPTSVSFDVFQCVPEKHRSGLISVRISRGIQRDEKLKLVSQNDRTILNCRLMTYRNDYWVSGHLPGMDLVSMDTVGEVFELDLENTNA